MYALGISKTDTLFQWAVVFRNRNGKLTVEKLGEGLHLPKEILAIQGAQIVTGIPAEEVLRRDVILPLTSTKILRKALTFQLEPCLPFPLNESVIFPQYYTLAKETLVVAWAATIHSLQTHIKKWQASNVDPDIVSSEALAIARSAEFYFPQKSRAAIIHGQTAVVIDHRKVMCAMNGSDPLRLKRFIQNKYPLFELIETDSDDLKWHHATAIGLALETFEKNPCQFRFGSFAPHKQKTFRRKKLIKMLGAAIGVVVATFITTQIILGYQRQKINDQIALYHPMIGNSLDENISNFRKQILREAKAIEPMPSIPTVQEVLSCLSTIQTPVDIRHVDYELVEYPQEEKNKPYRASMTILFQTKNNREADRFIQQLKQKPSLIEPTYEVKWTLQDQNYKISFPLRNRSP